MAKTRSQKLKTIQRKTPKGVKFDYKFLKRTKSVMVRLNKINIDDFDQKKITYCDIKLDKKDFKSNGE